MWPRPEIRIAVLCVVLALLAGCEAAAPEDPSSAIDSRLSALTPIELDPSFAEGFDKTFPNDSFADAFAQDALAEVYNNDDPRTQTQSISASMGAESKSFSFVRDDDTTCDGSDDDGDGAVDEDCDFGPEDCPAGMHVITGTGGWDLLWGTSGADCILGYGGSDLLIGSGGDDLIVGGPGNDAIRGGKGNDQLLGSSGDDLIYGDEDNDFIDGGDGNDAVLGGSGLDNVNGGACHDLILSSSGTDSLHGDAGSDRIDAFAPHSIDGGSGFDACSGVGCELTCAAAPICFWDGDCDAGEQCTRRSHICAPVTQAPIKDAICDGVDDDCDGEIDEEYASVSVACGDGSTSSSECIDGVVVDGCPDGGGGGGGCGGSTDATCNGVDDDCDAALDEDYVATPTSCGIGACAATGVLACVSGTVVDTCSPLLPASSDATCDAIDDDCSGTADEDFTASATTCGIGACSASGLLTCAGGTTHDSCVPGTAAPSDATCDLIDDDCSGAADEDYTPTPTSCDVAGCIRAGLLVCAAGALSDTCSDAQPCVAESACNDDLDNDGDLLVDCDDLDCSAETICDVQTFTITVAGTSSLWGAGLASPPGGGNLPPSVTLELSAGAIVRFTSVTGLVAQNGPGLAPDGTPGSEILPDSGAVAGFTHGTFGRTLAAVFLQAGPPSGAPPARLAFANQDFSSLSPLARQLFPIGDGLTSGAVRQQFVVPAGVTRLFVGITDRCNGNVPGCFDDNSGSFTVTGEIRYE